ncbi:MAG: NYN domain-containing protein [Chloroflexota bacterium]|nr:NYN domain-containing protein [Chloroflexota bacterium]
MRIVADVDGFNVYYACFRGHTTTHLRHLKWLDCRALVEAMFPDDDVQLVRFFTAIAPNPPDDPRRSTRHDLYRQALTTMPGVEVHAGRFTRSKRHAVLAHPPPGVDPLQTVWLLQEKQSDVGLTCHLLMDALDNAFDQAVLLSNDSDFVQPVRIVRERFGKDVIVVSPDHEVSRGLDKVATASRKLNRELLVRCQLPNPVSAADGAAITRSYEWDPPAQGPGSRPIT